MNVLDRATRREAREAIDSDDEPEGQVNESTLRAGEEACRQNIPIHELSDDDNLNATFFDPIDEDTLEDDARNDVNEEATVIEKDNNNEGGGEDDNISTDINDLDGNFGFDD